MDLRGVARALKVCETLDNPKYIFISGRNLGFQRMLIDFSSCVTFKTSSVLGLGPINKILVKIPQNLDQTLRFSVKSVTNNLFKYVSLATAKMCRIIYIIFLIKLEG